MSSEFRIRRADSEGDASQLNDFFTEVFETDEVGIFAETIFRHLPGMQQRYWFIAEEKESRQIAAAFALIPWTWVIDGVPCRVAEMGIVGTRQLHRKQGLQRILNREFDQTAAEDGFDLAIIQGIAGFYQQFGFAYALPLENQINLPLHLVKAVEAPETYTFRPAQEADIPFLVQADAPYRASFSPAAFRHEAHWRYLLDESLQAEYGSAFWIMEQPGQGASFYCRIPRQGFGSGLILSEVSQEMSVTALHHLFAFCKKEAEQRQLAYIRLNLHNDSTAGRLAVAMGAKPGSPYAWQIKIPDPVRLLTSLRPVLEKRIQASHFAGFSGTFRLNFFRQAIHLVWQDGRLSSIQASSEPGDYSFSLSPELFPPLCLGHRTWQELRHIRPDISPSSDFSALFIETLFPPRTGWIYQQY